MSPRDLIPEDAAPPAPQGASAPTLLQGASAPPAPQGASAASHAAAGNRRALAQACAFPFAGLALVADGAPALWHPTSATLVVADLHLDKGSALARDGFPCPGYDTPATLARLEAVVARRRPAQVVCLGDSVHRRDSWRHLGAVTRARLAALIARVERWVWITGNHDPLPDPSLGGSFTDAMVLDGLHLCHAPPPAAVAGSVAAVCGHLHPRAVLELGARRIAGPCFVAWSDLMILPAFGAFTGGLSVTDPAIAALRQGRPRLVLARRGAVVRVASTCRVG